MSSDVETRVDSELATVDETLIEGAEVALRIVENGRLVGVINIGEKTGEYVGDYPVIGEMIGSMEEDGIWQDWHAPAESLANGNQSFESSQFEVAGEGLGNYFLEEIGGIQYYDVDDGDELHVEAIGFESPYPELRSDS